MPSSSKVRTFHSLLHYTHMKHSKDDLLAGFGVGSTLELEEDQIDILITYLREILDRKEDEVSAERKKYRHQCLKIMSQIGIDTQDWNEVNKFMLNKHVNGRHLYELDVRELKDFKRKLYAIRNKIEQKRSEEGRLSRMN